MDLPSLLTAARTELRLPIGHAPPNTPPAASNLAPESPRLVASPAAQALPIPDAVHTTLLSLGSRYRPAAQSLADIATGRSTILGEDQISALVGQRSVAAVGISDLFVDGIEHGPGSVSRSPRTEGNRVELLVRNAEYLPRLRADLESATTSITVNQYNWERDGSGAWVTDLLRAKARAGVDVRVAVDGYGIQERGSGAADGLERDLAAAGVKFERTGGFRIGGSGFEHRKMITVDDRIAYTGGLGFGAKYDAWTDLMLRMEGPAGAVAGADALVTHRELSGSVDAAMQARLSTIRTTLREAAGGNGAVTSGPSADARAAVTLLDNRPGWDLAATESFLRDVDGATSRLWATSTYITTPVAADALMAAARRGVDVKLLVTAATAGNDSKQIHLGRAMYGDMIEAGVEIFEYPSIMHAKSWLKDDVTSVGSMNLSKSSMSRAREIMARVEDPMTAERYAQFHAQTRGEAHQVRKEDVDSLQLKAIGAITRAFGLQF